MYEYPQYFLDVPEKVRLKVWPEYIVFFSDLDKQKW